LRKKKGNERIFELERRGEREREEKKRVFFFLSFITCTYLEGVLVLGTRAEAV
jgi:hypothetical protein